MARSRCWPPSRPGRCPPGPGSPPPRRSKAAPRSAGRLPPAPPPHAAHLARHPGLGVVFLDGQPGMVARLPARPAALELWVTHAAEPVDIPEPGHLPPTGGSGQADTQTTDAEPSTHAGLSAQAGPSRAVELSETQPEAPRRPPAHRPDWLAGTALWRRAEHQTHAAHPGAAPEQPGLD